MCENRLILRLQDLHKVCLAVVCMLGLAGQLHAQAPSIDNGVAAGMTGSSAILNGRLLAGEPGPNNAVTIYWGMTDGGTIPGAWSTSANLGLLSIGPLATNISGLAASTTYFFRYFASNGSGTAWAPVTSSFMTPGAFVDVDGDGIDDNWEISWFGNTNFANTASDNDADGLRDALEYQHGCNPTMPDTDGDGLSDYTEVINGSDPANITSLPSPPIRDWTRIWGGTGAEYGYAAAVNSIGASICVAGYTTGAFDGETAVGLQDLCLTSFASNGTKQWTRIWGSTYGDYAQTVAGDSTGNAYVGGRTLGSFDGQTNVSVGIDDMCLTKFDSAGTRLWTRIWGSSTTDGVNAVAIDLSGNVYVAGYTAGGLDGQTNANPGVNDLYLAKFDSAGNRLWSRIWGSAGKEEAYALALDTTGGVYVAGCTDSSFDGQPNSGGNDICLSKFDSAGNRIWTRIWGSVDYDCAYSISIDPGGSVYVAGSTLDAFDGQVNANPGFYDLFLTKLDPAGNRIWSRVWGSPGDEYGRGVTLNPAGDIYVAGCTDDTFDGQPNNGGNDLCLSKFDASGTRLMTRIWGSSGIEYGTAAAGDSMGGIYVAGYTSGEFDGQINPGGNSLCLSRWSDPLPLAIKNMAPISITATSADMTGQVIGKGGGTMPYITCYWGTSDGGTVAGAWSTGTPLGMHDVGIVDNIQGSLTPGTTYYYRFFASNNVGTAWAPATTNLTTLPSALSFSIQAAHGAATPPPGTYTNIMMGSILTNWVTTPDNQGTTQYVCSGWTMTGNDPSAGPGSFMTLTLTNNAVLTWSWMTNFYLNVTPPSNGSLDTLSAWQPAGGITVITATPDIGHHLVSWTGDTVGCTPSGNQLTVPMTQARMISATFAINTNDIVATAGAGGTITPSGTIWLPYGAGTNFTIVPNANYHIAGVIVDGTPIGPTNSYTFVNVTSGGHIISASFAVDEYTLTVTSAHGSPVPGGVTSNGYGSLITASVNSPVLNGDTQYVCTGWVGGGSVPAGGVSNNVSFTITNNSILGWNWVTQYRMSAAAGANGSVVTSNGWYNAGQAGITATAVPLGGFYFTGWTGDVTGTNNPLILTMSQPYNLTANFAAIGCTITAAAGPNGAISPSGTVGVTYGLDQAFVITPNANYHVLDVVVDAASIGPTNSYTFFNVTNDHTISATFAIDVMTLSVASAHGTPVPAGVTTSAFGTAVSAQVDAVAANGTTQYVCQGWIGTGSAPASGATTNTGTFSLNLDSSVTWLWSTQYWISVSGGAGGSVSPASGWQPAGAPISVSASPGGGYYFVGWTGDVPPANTNDNPLSLPVDQPRSVTASFALSPAGTVSVTINPPAAVSAGAQWRLTTGPDTAWHASGYAVSNVPSAGNPYTVTFSAVAGFTSPADKTDVFITNGFTTARSGTYLTGAMVLVPGGTFQMSQTATYPGISVTLSDFYMDTKEVTVAEYQAFCAATATVMPPSPPWGWTDTSLPIVNVTWNEATAYAAWAGKRLPTEAEFEYAMRSGFANRLYPWGNSISAANANYANNVGQPTAAATYAASAYGLYDIAGNVWEWCGDWFQSVLTGPASNPTGPGSGTLKIIRGGSYISFASRLQSAGRYQLEPFARYNDLGFRCVADVPVGGAGGTAIEDANRNGIPDWWEKYYFGVAEGMGGAAFSTTADPDNDGLSNLHEYIAGTDPTNCLSSLDIAEIVAGSSGTFVLTWQSVPGKYYTVQRASDLLVGFQPVVSNVPATPPQNKYTDTTGAGNACFYRIKVQ